MKFVFQISESLVLRVLEISDAESIAKHADNKKIWVNLTDIFPHPYTLYDALTFIYSQSKIFPPQVFGIIYNNEAIGTVGLITISENDTIIGDLGYWISETYWNKGIMTKVIDYVVKFGFDYYKTMNEIFANVFTYNIASCRVLEKCGFTLEPDRNKTIMKAGKEEQLYSYVIRRK
jgi:[ribosomal protein S5]-alanine N-acetyltransferase